MSEQQFSWCGWLVCAWVCLLCLKVQAQPTTSQYARQINQTADAVCPVQLGDYLITDFRFKEGSLCFYATIAESDLAGFDSVTLRQFFADRIRYQEWLEPFGAFYVPLKQDVKGGLVYVLRLMENDSVITLRYSAEEVRQFLKDSDKPEYKNSDQWVARYLVARQIYVENLEDETEDADFSTDTILLVDSWVTYSYLLRAPLSWDEEVLPGLDETKKNITNVLLTNPSYTSALFYAGYGLRFLYWDADHTRSFKLDYPNEQLKQLMAQSEQLQEASDDEMRAYLKEFARKDVEISREEMLARNEELMEVEFDYEDDILQLVLTYEDDAVMEQRDVTALKDLLLSHWAYLLMTEFTPAVQGNKVYTLDHCYGLLKGVRLVFVENKSHRYSEIMMSVDELQNAEPKAFYSHEDLQAEALAKLELEEFKRVLEMTNEQCPIPAGNVMMTKVVYDGKALHFHYELEEEELDFLDTADLRTLMEHVLQMEIQNDFGHYIAQLGLGIRLHILYVPTRDSLLLAFSPQEVRSLLATESDSLTESRNALSIMVRANNRHCPMELPDFGRIDSLSISQDQLIYYYTIRADLADYFFMNSMEDLRSNVQSSLAIEDPTGKTLLQYCVTAGYGICQRFAEPPVVPKSPKRKHVRAPRVRKVCFSVEELRAILQGE